VRIGRFTPAGCVDLARMHHDDCRFRPAPLPMGPGRPADARLKRLSAATVFEAFDVYANVN